MKDAIIQDLCKHYREKSLKQIDDIVDTCERISDTDEEAMCAASYIVIRTLLAIVSAMCMRHGASKEEFMELVSGYWDSMAKTHQKWETKNG